MRQVTALQPPGQILDLIGHHTGSAQVRADMENMLAALVRRHGPVAAQLLLADAALHTLADAARGAGHAFAMRFALEHEIHRAFAPQKADEQATAYTAGRK